MYGQVSFFDANVSKYGELERVLGEKWDKIDSLVVHGPINEDDFKIMWKCSFEGKLTVLNLEDTQIEGRKIPRLCTNLTMKNRMQRFLCI